MIQRPLFSNVHHYFAVANKNAAASSGYKICLYPGISLLLWPVSSNPTSC
jgi:hypothetical protein